MDRFLGSQSPYDPEDALDWQGDYDEGDEYGPGDLEPFTLPGTDEPPSPWEAEEEDEGGRR